MTDRRLGHISLSPPPPPHPLYPTSEIFALKRIDLFHRITITIGKINLAKHHPFTGEKNLLRSR